MNKKIDSIKNLIAKRRARLAPSTSKIPVQEALDDNKPAVSVDGVSEGLPTEQAVDEAPVEQLAQDETPTEVGEVTPTAETAEITQTEGVASEKSVEVSPAVEPTTEEPTEVPVEPEEIPESPKVSEDVQVVAEQPTVEVRRRRRRRTAEESDV